VVDVDDVVCFVFTSQISSGVVLAVWCLRLKMPIYLARIQPISGCVNNSARITKYVGPKIKIIDFFELAPISNFTVRET
jgi:hypothetical protein